MDRYAFSGRGASYVHHNIGWDSLGVRTESGGSTACFIRIVIGAVLNRSMHSEADEEGEEMYEFSMKADDRVKKTREKGQTIERGMGRGSHSGKGRRLEVGPAATVIRFEGEMSKKADTDHPRIPRPPGPNRKRKVSLGPGRRIYDLDLSNSKPVLDTYRISGPRVQIFQTPTSAEALPSPGIFQRVPNVYHPSARRVRNVRDASSTRCSGETSYAIQRRDFEIDNYGTISIEEYQEDRKGCRIKIRFTPGEDMPKGTDISFIQAIRTVARGTGGVLEDAQMRPGRPADLVTMARIDQIEHVPSPYYLDMVGEAVTQLISWLGQPQPWPERGAPVTKYENYKVLAMEGTELEEKVYNQILEAHKGGRKKLNELLCGMLQIGEHHGGERVQWQGFTWNTHQVRTYLGRRPRSRSFGVSAQLFDNPYDNLVEPKRRGKATECVFHTGVVTKVAEGEARVWAVIEWGYRRVWHLDWLAPRTVLVPIRLVDLGTSMLPPALRAFWGKEGKEGRIGPAALVGVK